MLSKTKKRTFLVSKRRQRAEAIKKKILGRNRPFPPSQFSSCTHSKKQYYIYTLTSIIYYTAIQLRLLLLNRRESLQRLIFIFSLPRDDNNYYLDGERGRIQRKRLPLSAAVDRLRNVIFEGFLIFLIAYLPIDINTLVSRIKITEKILPLQKDDLTRLPTSCRYGRTSSWLSSRRNRVHATFGLKIISFYYYYCNHFHYTFYPFKRINMIRNDTFHVSLCAKGET